MADQPQTNPDGGKTDTTDYSASKAPETRAAVEHKHGGSGSNAIPGGPRGAAMDVGMSSMDHHDDGAAPDPSAKRSE